MNNGIHIIDSREESTMVSNWTVYLCTIITDEMFRIAHMKREPLGYAEDFIEYDEEGYEVAGIPDVIDGKDVFGLEDGVVIGFNLYEDETDIGQDISYCDLEAANIIDTFINNNRWSKPNASRIKGMFDQKKATK